MDKAINNKAYQPSIQEKTFSEQVKILHNNLLLSIPANFFCASIIFIGLYQVNRISILCWFTAVIFISVFRLAAFYFYKKRPNHDNLHFSIFLIGLTVSSILWGLVDSILMPIYPEQQMIVFVIIAGITAGGIQTLNASLKACVIYISFIIVPLCIWLFLQNNMAYSLIGSAMLAYLAFMLVTSIRGYKLLNHALTLQYENLSLVEKLSVTNTKLLNAYKIQERHEHKIVLLNKMNDMLQACQELKEAYEVIKLTGNELFSGFSGGLFMQNLASHQLEMAMQWGEEKTLDSAFALADCWALRKGHEYQINRPDKGLICPHFNSSPNTSICLPLNIQTQNMGLLVVYSMTKEAFSSEQLQLANTFSEVIQLSLSNIKLRETLYEQSIHDPLTGLFNRRYLDETLLRELQRAIREKRSLCVAMLDLDHFKIFNDSNGHEAGDEVLKFLGTLLLDHFRGTDISCRYGGEEFMVIMINTDLSSAMLRLEHLREAVKKGELYFQNRKLPSITVSIGIAEAPRQGITTRDIVHAADMALYAAKQAGRDRIEYSHLAI